MPTTPQDRRPPLAKKQTRSSEAKRRKILDETLAITVDGVEYKVTPSDINGLLERRIRQETGMSVVENGERLFEHPGIDYLANFMWAVRLSWGEDVTLDEVLEGITYDAEVVFPEDPKDVKPAGPKASAKSSSSTSPA